MNICQVSFLLDSKFTEKRYLTFLRSFFYDTNFYNGIFVDVKTQACLV